MTSVILILTDDQQKSTLAPGMPQFMARTDFTEYPRAYSSRLLCKPERASIFTGQVKAHGVVTNTAGELDDTNALPVWMKAAGKRTGIFGKYLNGATGAPVPGYDVCCIYGGDADPPPYNNPLFYENGTPVQYSGYSTDILASKACGFIADSIAAQTDFFLLVSLNAPHVDASGKAMPPARYADTYAAAQMPQTPAFNNLGTGTKPPWLANLPPVDFAEVQDDWRARLGAVRAIDDAIAAIMSAINLADTLVIVTTDQGLGGGDHRLTKKGNAYEPTSNNLLYIAPGGGADQSIVSSVDLTLHMCNFAGATPGLPQDGVPVGSRTAALMYWPGGVGGPGAPNIPQFWALRYAGWKYVEYPLAKQMFYLGSDPYETANLAGTQAGASIQSQLAAMLASMKAALA